MARQRDGRRFTDVIGICSDLIQLCLGSGAFPYGGKRRRCLLKSRKKVSDNFLVQTAVSNPFAPEMTSYAGLARISDLQIPQWRRAFQQCEAFSDQLLESKGQWMSADYPWRIDPLHCWSRIWEYPFALSAIDSDAAVKPLTIIDVGPGANFYLPLLGRLGHRVCGVDMDPAVVRAGQRLANFICHPSASPSYVVGDAHQLPFEDGQADVVQSLSVLEHIPKAHAIVPELARVLSPSGTLILTLDLALHGSDGLNVAELRQLFDALGTHFDMPDVEAGDLFANALHDADTLTNFTSPRNLRAKEQRGPAHSQREVNHWPPIAHDWLRPRSIRRALRRARSRNQPLMAIWALKTQKRGFATGS